MSKSDFYEMLDAIQAMGGTQVVHNASPETVQRYGKLNLPVQRLDETRRPFTKAPDPYLVSEPLGGKPEPRMGRAERRMLAKQQRKQERNVPQIDPLTTPADVLMDSLWRACVSGSIMYSRKIGGTFLKMLGQLPLMIGGAAVFDFGSILTLDCPTSETLTGDEYDTLVDEARAAKESTGSFPRPAPVFAHIFRATTGNNEKVAIVYLGLYPDEGETDGAGVCFMVADSDGEYVAAGRWSAMAIWGHPDNDSVRFGGWSGNEGMSQMSDVHVASWLLQRQGSIVEGTPLPARTFKPYTGNNKPPRAYQPPSVTVLRVNKARIIRPRDPDAPEPVPTGRTMPPHDRHNPPMVHRWIGKRGSPERRLELRPIKPVAKVHGGSKLAQPPVYRVVVDSVIQSTK